MSSAIPGMIAASARRRFGVVVPFSAGLLLGVMTLGLLPEAGSEIGWALALTLFTCGYALLYGINRYVYPVCPTCSHTHDHSGCAMVLHGFAGPLLAAAALHSFLDGWSLASAPDATGLAVAIALHKVPEGIALGALFAAAVKTRSAVMGWVLLAELPTLLGAFAGVSMAESFGAAWTHYLLAAAGGSLLFLGSHAIHNEWKQRGAVPAMAPAVAGLAGAAAIQYYAAFFRFPFG